MQAVLNILGVGGVYALIACGLVLIYRTSRVVNLSQGHLAIFCVYCAAFLSTAGHSWFLAVGVAIFAGCAIGAFIHLAIMKRILGEPPFVGLMTTIGLAIFLNGLIVFVFGGSTMSLEPIMSGTVEFAGMHVPTAHILATIGSWIAVAIVVGLNYYTRLGLLMRAVTADVVLASQRGVNINLVVGIAWVIAVAAAAAAGVFYGQRALISSAAVLIGVNGLIAALIGGMDSFRGAIIGALAVATVEYGTVQILSSRYAEMAPAILMLVMLTFRPWGLFGTVEEVERV